MKHTMPRDNRSSSSKAEAFVGSIGNTPNSDSNFLSDGIKSSQAAHHEAPREAPAESVPSVIGVQYGNQGNGVPGAPNGGTGRENGKHHTRREPSSHGGQSGVADGDSQLSEPNLPSNPTLTSDGVVDPIARSHPRSAKPKIITSIPEDEGVEDEGSVKENIQADIETEGEERKFRRGCLFGIAFVFLIIVIVIPISAIAGAFDKGFGDGNEPGLRGGNNVSDTNTDNNSAVVENSVPTFQPTTAPTRFQSGQPHNSPTISPTDKATIMRSDLPTNTPTAKPSALASATPTSALNRSPSLTAALVSSKLRCGIPEELAGFHTIVNGNSQGFEVDMCRAIAAAIFGPSFENNLELVTVSRVNSFSMLNNGDVDVLAAHTTFTMERNLHESSTQKGYAFSEPYLHDNLGIGGVPEFVDCAARQDTTVGNCTRLEICVLSDTTYIDVLSEIFPVQNLVISPTVESYYTQLRNGICNVLAGGQFEIAESVVRANRYVGDYTVRDTSFSKEPLSLVTRTGDPVWSDFVNWVSLSLMYAEENGITQNNAMASAPEVDVFGPEFLDMVKDAVSTVGNYGEIYNRHLQGIVPRQPINQINTGDQPLLYSFPFQDTLVLGTGVSSDLDAIRRRGLLKCAVRRKVGFAEFNPSTQTWTGLDVDICKAISAAIFGGVFSTIEYVEFPASVMFAELQAGTVDVLSRTVTTNLPRDAAGMGSSFAPTVFYDGLSFAGIPPFGQCADEVQTLGQCAALKICVAEATTTIATVRSLFAESFIVPSESIQIALQGLEAGRCNTVADDSTGLTEDVIRIDGGYTGDYEIGKNFFSKEPLAPITRQSDPQFAAFVYWIVMSLFYAEEQGITQMNSGDMPGVSLFGPQYSQMFRNVIAAVGNYGEIYDRNLKSTVPRSGANRLNTVPYGPQLFVRPGLK